MRTLILMCAIAISAVAQPPTPPSNYTLPAEAAGTDAIVRTLISAFDHYDIVALGEAHEQKQDSALRIALVRNPDFAKKVRFIVVEFASTTEQSTLDRYIRGESVSPAELAQVWKTTTQAPNGTWDSPIYPEFFAAVRDVNSKLSIDQKIRVLGGDPGPGDNRSREIAAVTVTKEQVLHRNAKALVIYGTAHFYRALPDEYLASMGEDIGIVNMLETYDPGRILSVIWMGRLNRSPEVIAGAVSDYQKFDSILTTQVRPVFVSLKQPPFRDLSAEEFLGGTVMMCRPPGGCHGMFQGSRLTLGQIADACIYFGGSADADEKEQQAR